MPLAPSVLGLTVCVAAVPVGRSHHVVTRLACHQNVTVNVPPRVRDISKLACVKTIKRTKMNNKSALKSSVDS